MDKVIEKQIQSQSSEAEEFARARASGDTPNMRSCLACDKPFESEGWHNRLCPPCRKRSGDSM
jgi:hypothetical protein